VYLNFDALLQGVGGGGRRDTEVPELL